MAIVGGYGCAPSVVESPSSEHPTGYYKFAPNASRTINGTVDVSGVSVYTLFMLARVYSCAVIGLDGVLVEGKVNYTSGFPGMTMIGTKSQWNHQTTRLSCQIH